MTNQALQLASLAARYTRFAAECDGISPRYAFLVTQIAGYPALPKTIDAVFLPHVSASWRSCGMKTLPT
jgi:hypothetical protein